MCEQLQGELTYYQLAKGRLKSQKKHAKSSLPRK